MKKPAEVLAMIISAIKNLREMKGSTTREILHYISSVYDIPATVARRQTQAALKRGVAYGILKKNRGYYVLPTNERMQGQEIAAQELDLVNLYRNKVTERGGRGCKRRRRSRRSRRKCKCKRSARSRRRSSRGCKRRRRSRRKCKCGGLGRSRRRSDSATASPKKKFTDEIPVNTTNDKDGKDDDEPVSENSSTSTLTSVEQ